MLTLYTYFRSSASYRVRIALNYKNLPYEKIAVHLLKDGGQQLTAQYRALNPQGLVPTLVDNGRALTQSMAILEYLEEKHPTPTLLPEQPYDKAIVRSMAQLVVDEIQPLNNLRVMKYLKHELNLSEEAKVKWHHHWVQEGLSALEELVKKHGGKCCFGDQPTFADIALIPQLHNAKRFECPLNDYPRLLAINEFCLSLPAFENARPENQEDAE